MYLPVAVLSAVTSVHVCVVSVGASNRIVTVVDPAVSLMLYVLCVNDSCGAVCV